MSSNQRQQAADALNRRYNAFLTRRDANLVFTAPDAAVKFLQSKSSTDPKPQLPSVGTQLPSVGVNMLAIAKERFRGGVNIWLVNKSLHPITARQIDQILAMDIKSRGEDAFRLSVWDSGKHAPDYVDPDTIPIGSEIVADNVTGLKLYLGQVAQGNASRVTVVHHGEDRDSVLDSNPAFDSESSDEEHRNMDEIRTGIKVTAKRTRSMLRHVRLSDSDTSDGDIKARAQDQLQLRPDQTSAGKGKRAAKTLTKVQVKTHQNGGDTSDSDTSYEILGDSRQDRTAPLPSSQKRRKAPTVRRMAAKPSGKVGTTSKPHVQAATEPEPEAMNKRASSNVDSTSRKRRKL